MNIFWKNAFSGLKLPKVVGLFCWIFGLRQGTCLHPSPSCSKSGSLYSLDKSLSSSANIFCLTLLARFLHRPMIHNTDF